jgi:hypothetical protein
MRISAATAFIAWILVVLNIDPEKSGIAGQALFYVSSFLFFAGAAILLLTWIRKIIEGNDEVALSYLGVGFRQGVLVSLLIMVLLFLQQYKILTWWDGMLVTAGILLIELYFLTKK